MKIVYHRGVDAMHIFFSDRKVEESDETHEGIIIDYDSEGNPIGIEILDASKRMTNPSQIDYQVSVEAA